MDGWMIRHTNEWMDGWIYRQAMDEWIYRQAMDQRIYRQVIDGWINGYTDGSMDQ